MTKPKRTEKRSHRAWTSDLDLRALAKANRAIAETSKRMRQPALEFLWDKYVRHGDKEPEPKR